MHKTMAIVCMALLIPTALALLILEVIALKNWMHSSTSKLFSNKQRKLFLIAFSAFMLIGFIAIGLILSVRFMQNPEEIEWFYFALTRLPFGLVEVLGIVVLIKNETGKH